MLCEACKKNEATFYYQENVNGVKKTYRLCRSCADAMTASGEIGQFDAEKYFASSPLGTSLFGESLASLLFGTGEGKPGTALSEKACSGCGMTLREFARDGMAGCPQCYTDFEDELAATIRRVQGKSSHTGRVPAKRKEMQDLRQKIADLESEQKKAIAAEDYERAAQIRDELKKLRADAE